MLEVQKLDRSTDYELHTMESYVNSNTGRLLDLWSGLLRGLSALSRNTNGDADVGIITIDRILDELVRFDNDKLPPRDYIAAYFLSTVSPDAGSRAELKERLERVRRTLERVKTSQANAGEIANAESTLNAIVDQLKYLARDHHLKFASIMFGVHRNNLP
jgi:hypothetical protein